MSVNFSFILLAPKLLPLTPSQGGPAEAERMCQPQNSRTKLSFSLVFKMSLNLGPQSCLLEDNLLQLSVGTLSHSMFSQAICIVSAAYAGALSSPPHLRSVKQVLWRKPGRVGRSDVANQNTGCSVKYKFQTNNKILHGTHLKNSLCI